MINKNKLPDTVKNPKSFIDSQWSITCPHCGEIIGYDGAFFWKWIIEAIKEINPKSNISPMDFDGVVERKGHYLICETKDPNKPISNGQNLTLNNLCNAKSFSIVKIWGKDIPEKMIINYGWEKPEIRHITRSLQIRAYKHYIKKWYKYADEN